MQLAHPTATLTMLVAFVACAQRRDDATKARPTIVEPATGFVALDRWLFSGEDSKRISCFRVGRLLISTPSFQQRVDWDTGRRDIVVINSHLSPDGNWEEVKYAYPTAYDVMCVDGRQSDELIVVGRTGERDDIIERWTIVPSQGSHYFHVERASTPIGVPAGPLPSTNAGIVGGTYVPVAERQSTPNVSKEELYRGSVFDKAVDISVDPEGRFAIVLDQKKRSLYRVSLRDDANPEVLFTDAEIPFLANARSVYRMQHYEQGRVYILEGEPTRTGSFYNCMLFDADNDGLFESARTMSSEQFAARGYLSSVWLSNLTQFDGPKPLGIR